MLAKQAPTMAFTTLAHNIDKDWLREAYRQAIPGIQSVEVLHPWSTGRSTWRADLSGFGGATPPSLTADAQVRAVPWMSSAGGLASVPPGHGSTPRAVGAASLRASAHAQRSDGPIHRYLWADSALGRAQRRARQGQRQK
jgi:hypothetical protein